MENLLQQLRSPSSKGRKQKRGQTTSVTLPLSAPKHSLPSSGLKTQRIKKNQLKAAAAVAAHSPTVRTRASLCCGGDISCSPNNAVSGPSVIRAAISKSQPLWKYFKKKKERNSFLQKGDAQAKFTSILSLLRFIISPTQTAVCPQFSSPEILF